ncbi:hypothetical protein ACIA47_19360 [Micromonospora sp. NPDC051227]|uniref:hypothetical protein n=1 Tax=Micromonospora sp. NPDC051227 TaxID=3364285 RepID=UPI0037A9F52B
MPSQKVGKPNTHHPIMEVVRQRYAADGLPRRCDVIDGSRRQFLCKSEARAGIPARIAQPACLTQPDGEGVGTFGSGPIVLVEPLMLELFN